MSSQKSRFSRKTQKGLSMTSERSSEWAADFKNASQIFIAYKNFKKLFVLICHCSLLV